jgi:DNA-binding MarR family transcriptional regulator
MKENTTDEIVSTFFNTFRVFKQKLDMRNPIYNMPLAHMEALRFIDEKKQVLMKEVADFLAITPPSATVLINNLVSSGFVQRGSSKNDRRTVHLSLTKKGAEVLQKGIKDRCVKFKKLLINLNQKEKSQFLHILKIMIKDN